MIVSNNMIKKLLLLPESHRNFYIDQVDSVGSNEHTLMFINKLGYDLKSLDDTSNSCIFLISYDYPTYTSTKNEFIRVGNPKFEFCLLVEHFQLPSKLQKNFKHTGFHSALRYCHECIIGDNCVLDSGTIIGGTDFSPVMGYDRSTLVQFPQLGGVMIGNNVVIKYNTMIGKGTFGFTKIGDNTMIDFGCQIGHNCIIGNSCIIAAGTIIGGSTIVGDNVTIGIGARIRNGIHIGNNASIGMGSVVIKDVPDNCVVVGNPAHPIEHEHIMSERGLV